MIGTVYRKICSENQLLGENMKTNSKNVFRSSNFFLKLGTCIVHKNMYSQEKVEMKTQTRKNHTKMTNMRFMWTKRQNP